MYRVARATFTASVSIERTYSKRLVTESTADVVVAEDPLALEIRVAMAVCGTAATSFVMTNCPGGRVSQFLYSFLQE